MEIVIENPGEGNARMIHQRPYHVPYVTGSSPAPEYYGNLKTPSPQRDFLASSEHEGATSVRRVDRSGLLEIAEAEPRSTQRLLTGAEKVHSVGTLRRADRSGFLEAVPEVPDQNFQASGEPSNIHSNQGRSIRERHLTGAEMDEETRYPLSLSPRSHPTRSPISDPNCLEIRSSGEMHDSMEDRKNHLFEAKRKITGSTHVFAPGGTGNLEPSSTTSTSSATTTTATGHHLCLQERKVAGFSPISTRISPLVVKSQEIDQSKSKGQFAPPTGSKFVPIDPGSNRKRQSCIEFFQDSPYFSTDGNSTLPRDTRETFERLHPRSRHTSPLTVTSMANSGSSSTEPLNSMELGSCRERSSELLGRLSPRLRADRQSPMTLSIPDVIEAHGSSAIARADREREVPDGERAEAEGCEHTAIESLEEARVSFKAPNKLIHNDNIQTLRVIILSEQL